MKHALIVGHPNEQSFTLSVARAYEQAVKAQGHETIMRDLYRAGFDPALRDGEIPRPGGFKAGEDVKAERALLDGVQVFAFFYPLWFNVPPAIVSGYIQRVFGMGFGYGPIRQGANQRLLLGRSMISFSSSGAPAEWLRTEGGWGALTNLFDEHVAAVCGLTVLDHRHFGRVTSSTPACRIEAHLSEVARVVDQHFAPKRGET